MKIKQNPKIPSLQQILWMKKDCNLLRSSNNSLSSPKEKSKMLLPLRKINKSITFFINIIIIIYLFNILMGKLNYSDVIRTICQSIILSLRSVNTIKKYIIVVEKKYNIVIANLFEKYFFLISRQIIIHFLIKYSFNFFATIFYFYFKIVIVSFIIFKLTLRMIFFLW